MTRVVPSAVIAFLTALPIAAQVEWTSILTNGTLPYIGRDLVLEVAAIRPYSSVVVAIGASRTLAGGLPLPFELSPLGSPGCYLLVSPDVVLPATPALASATLRISIPTLSNLVGATFHTQGLIMDPGMVLGGILYAPPRLLTTNGVTATIGDP